MDVRGPLRQADAFLLSQQIRRGTGEEEANDRLDPTGGYCFAGVPMGSYMGGKLAARILGRNDVATPFDDLDFPAVPLHGAVSRLTPHLLRYWEWRDSAA